MRFGWLGLNIRQLLGFLFTFIISKVRLRRKTYFKYVQIAESLLKFLSATFKIQKLQLEAYLLIFRKLSCQLRLLHTVDIILTLLNYILKSNIALHVLYTGVRSSDIISGVYF